MPDPQTPPAPLAPMAVALARSIDGHLSGPAALMVPAPIRQSVQRLAALVVLMAGQLDRINHQEPTP